MRGIESSEKFDSSLKYDNREGMATSYPRATNNRPPRGAPMYVPGSLAEANVRRLNTDNANRSRENATQATADALARSGAQVPAGATQPGQSAANGEQIARAAYAATTGHMMPPGGGSAPMYTPAGAAAAPANRTAMGGAFRGSTPAEIKEFQDTAPGSANSPTAKALTAAAGSGKTVTTPYGTASSTVQAPGTEQGPVTNSAASQAESGPQHAAPLNWQQQVVAKYPSIGQAGHPDNAAFVKAYKDAAAAVKPNADGTPGKAPDHMALADNIAGPGGDQPTGVSNAGKGAELAKTKTIPTQPPVSTARAAGEAIASAPADAGNAIVSGIQKVGTPILKAAGDFLAGVTGRQGQQAGDSQVALGTPQPGPQTGTAKADQSARAGLAAQQNPSSPMYTGSVAPGADTTASGSGGSFNPADAHSDIHAATVKAITAAGQNAHDAVNSTPSFSGSVAPNPAPAAPSAQPQATPSFSTGQSATTGL
jgi:hypothetical protein